MMFSDYFSLQHHQRREQYQQHVSMLAVTTGLDRDMLDRWCRELAQTSTIPPISAVYQLTMLWGMSDEALRAESILPGLSQVLDLL